MAVEQVPRAPTTTTTDAVTAARREAFVSVKYFYPAVVGAVVEQVALAAVLSDTASRMVLTDTSATDSEDHPMAAGQAAMPAYSLLVAVARVVAVAHPVVSVQARLRPMRLVPRPAPVDPARLTILAATAVVLLCTSSTATDWRLSIAAMRQ